jgi:sporulation protein YlmC with PRC-barrel domain
MARSEQPANQLTHINDGELSMKPNQKAIEAGRFWRARRCSRPQWLTVLVTVAIIAGAQVPKIAAAEVALVVVDVVAVADGYRASKLRGATVVNSKNEKVGELDDLIVGKDRVLFGIVEVGGFLGLGSHLIAVPYSSLQISEEGKRIVLPGASKEHVKDLPEFKYR